MCPSLLIAACIACFILGLLAGRSGHSLPKRVTAPPASLLAQLDAIDWRKVTIATDYPSAPIRKIGAYLASQRCPWASWEIRQCLLGDPPDAAGRARSARIRGWLGAQPPMPAL